MMRISVALASNDYIRSLHFSYTLYKVANGEQNDTDIEEEELSREWKKAKTALTVSNLKHIKLNNRIVKVICKQMGKLHNEGRKSRSSGGKSFVRLKNKWSHIPYKLKIYFTECDTKLLKRENVELRTGIEQEKSKRIKLEKSNTFYQRRFRSICKKIIRTQNKQRRISNRSFVSYSVRQKQRVRNRLKEECMDALTFFGHYDLIPTKITYFNEEVNQQEELHLVDNISDFSSNLEDNAATEIVDKVSMLLYIKDRFAISDKAWKELRNVDNNMASLYSLKALMLNLNSRWNIFPTPGDTEGVQMSFLVSITNKIRKLVQDGVISACGNVDGVNNDDGGGSLNNGGSSVDDVNNFGGGGSVNNGGDVGDIDNCGGGCRLNNCGGGIGNVNNGGGEGSKIIKVKISGDGTNIGKRLNIVNVTYTILNEKQCMSERGNYPLVIVKCKEDYHSLKVALSDLICELQECFTILVDGFNYKIQFFLGGDWKFLATVCGLGAATSEFACIWCKVPKSLRYDMTKEWSLIDPKKGARTIKEIQSFSKRTQKNCKFEPIFPFIPLSRVMIDTLHLYLRIADVLIENLIQELRVLDTIDKTTLFKAGAFCREKHKYMSKYESFLAEIGINFKWFVNKDSRKLEYRDLTGPEKLLLFQKINILDLMEDEVKGITIQKLWDNFSKLICEIKEDFREDSKIELYAAAIKSWISEYNDIYTAASVTPYMHAFSQHIPEFLKLYGNINIFNQQGLEKYNDQSSRDYFRSTNHRNLESLRQMLLKKNRVQLLEAMGAECAKKSYLCSNCNISGHSIKTCTAECNICSFHTCCGHLEKLNTGKWRQICLAQ